MTPEFDQQKADLEAFHADSLALAGLIEQLDKALPDFKGLPAPVDWARVALMKIIEDRENLLTAAEYALERIQADWPTFHDPAQDTEEMHAIITCEKLRYSINEAKGKIPMSEQGATDQSPV